MKRLFLTAFAMTAMVLSLLSTAKADAPKISVEVNIVKVAPFSLGFDGKMVSSAGAEFKIKATEEKSNSVKTLLRPSKSRTWVFMRTKLPDRNIVSIKVTTEDGKELVQDTDFFLNKTGALALPKDKQQIKVTAEYTYLTERYNSIFLDPKSGKLIIKSGPERSIDAEEQIPQTPQGMLRVCNLAVLGEKIEPVLTLDKPDCVQGREYLKDFFAKLKKGDTIKLCGYGDSITAVQSGAVGFGPNSTNHDRAERFFSRYRRMKDTMAKVETFDFGDGVGKKHCKMGWNWRLAEALEAKFGVTVKYLNCGIGSTTSANSIRTIGKNKLANGLYPERIETVLATKPDLVVVAFGMNERGRPTTEGNVTEIIKRFQAIGAAVIVMGVPKINGCMWFNKHARGAWEKTNAILEKVASENKAAFIDTRKANLETVPRHFCASNNYNHPGIHELLVYGKALASVTE